MIPASADHVVAFHVLPAGCRCSKQVAGSLARSRRPLGVEEHLLLVDDDDHALEDSFPKSKFTVHHATGRDLAAEFDVSGVPLLLVVGRGQEVDYSGGYTERKQGVVSRDVTIIEAVGRGERPEALPLFGCTIPDESARTASWWSR